VFDGHQGGAAPFAADGEPLGQPQQGQQDRRRDTDLRIGGQRTHQHGGGPHDQQRVDQHPLAADPVSVVPEDDAAEWTCDEPDAECREGQQESGGR
jgi:hypothetical protein